MSSRRSVAFFALLATFSVSACSGDDSVSPTTDAPTTLSPATDPPETEAPTTETVDPAVEAMMYTEAGPYPVGVTT
ncbi:MAG: hypothetical protein RIS69_1132, partial [Actinomycetota bacterium]